MKPPRLKLSPRKPPDYDNEIEEVEDAELDLPPSRWPPDADKRDCPVDLQQAASDVRYSYDWQKRDRFPKPGTYLWLRVWYWTEYKLVPDIATAAKMLHMYGVHKLTFNLSYQVVGVGPSSINAAQFVNFTASIHWGQGVRPPADDVVRGLTDAEYDRLVVELRKLVGRR